MPTYFHFLTGAALGACVGVWVRIIGALVLNGFVEWTSLDHLLFHSILVPKLALYTFITYVIAGTPFFLLARRRNRIRLRLFLGVGAALGWFASFPELLIPSWAFVYVLAGIVSAAVGFGVMVALAGRRRTVPANGL